jgi:RND family efflux transporter MFP subunit
MISHSLLSGLTKYLLYGLAVILFVAAMYTLSGCEDNNSSIQAAKKQQIRHVELIKIEPQVVPVILPVPGTVVSKDRLKVASRITGFIEKIMVDEGDIVKSGDSLVEIDSAQVEAAIKGAHASVLAAKADLADAKGDVKRIEKLVNSKTLAEDDLRNAIVRRTQAEATLATAEADVVAKQQDRRYSHIISPVHAQVRERLRDPGDLAATGEPILQLDVLGDMELEVYLPSTSIGNVSVGQAVNVEVKSCDNLLVGKISRIVRSADKVTRRYKVSLLLPEDENLTPGQFGNAQIILREKIALSIPVSAIIERAGIDGVFIKDASNTLRFRSVRLGKVWQNMHEVLAGLEENSLLVTNPSRLLHDGDKVSFTEIR